MRSLFVFLLMGFMTLSLAAESVNPTLAVLPFNDRMTGYSSAGREIADLLTANLSTQEKINLVEREKLNAAIAEFKLSHSALFNEQQSTDIARISGARLLLTGTVFQSSDNYYLVAKLICVDNGRSIGVKVSGKPNIPQLTELLSREIIKILNEKSVELLPVDSGNQKIDVIDLKALKKYLAAKKFPSLLIRIKEEYIGIPEQKTEVQQKVQNLCHELSVPLAANAKEADLILSGSFFCRFYDQNGPLVSVAVEGKIIATDRSGKIVTQYGTTVIRAGCDEIQATKSAIHESTEKIALKILPTLVK